MGLGAIAFTISTVAWPFGFAADHASPRRPMLARIAYGIAALMLAMGAVIWAIDTAQPLRMRLLVTGAVGWPNISQNLENITYCCFAGTAGSGWAAWTVDCWLRTAAMIISVDVKLNE